MGGVVALSSRVSATFGWRRPHRIPLQEGYFLTWSVSLTAQTPATRRRRSLTLATLLKRKLKASSNLAPCCALCRRLCRRCRLRNQSVGSRWIDTSTWGRPLRGRCRCRFTGSPGNLLTQPTSTWPPKVSSSIAPRRKTRNPKQEIVTTSSCGQTL